MRAALEILSHTFNCFRSMNRKKAMSNRFKHPRPVRVFWTKSRVVPIFSKRFPWAWKIARKVYRDLSRLWTSSTTQKCSPQFRLFHLFSVKAFPTPSIPKKHWAWKPRLTLKLISYKFRLDITKFSKVSQTCNLSHRSNKNLWKIPFNSPRPPLSHLCPGKIRYRSPNVI